MRRRPLCLAAILLFLILMLIPKDVWLKKPDIPSGKAMVLSGTVVKREQKEEKNIYYLKNCLCEQTNSKFSVLAYTPKGDLYPIGCKISLYGTIYQLNKADNPGQFDGNSYYQSQGILYTFQTEFVISYEGKNYLKDTLAQIREFIGEKILIVYEERDAGILKAVLLGDKSSLREEDELLYQKNGISHLLAISGLHISMIGMTFYRLLRRWNLTFIEAGIPSGILLLLYGMLTGFGISTIRAVCMFLVMIFADIFGRAYDMASGMALAVLIILMQNPLQARQAGFLLSFGAVLGICMVYPILQSMFEPRTKAGNALLFSVSLLLMTYPISVHFFYEFSIYSILLNFIVIPCMPVVMGFGGLGALVGCVSPNIGRIVGVPAHAVLSVYECLGTWTISLPFSSIRLGCEDLWQIIIYYVFLVLALIGLWYGKRRIYVFLIPMALVIVSLRFYGPLEFTMLDVGQGDGLFLRLQKGTVCLIDGGSTSVKNVGKYRILPFLKYEGVEKLDYVIFTHLDEDHVNGVRELIELSDTYDGVVIGQLLFPNILNPDETYMELWELAKQYGIKTGKIGKGDRLYGDDWEINCLLPENSLPGFDKNESSTVLEVNFEEFSILLTGDLGIDGEKNLLHMNLLKDIDVWKVSHHGSKYSGSTEFLSVIRPELSIISVGKNPYGHPNEELLQRICDVKSYVETTIESGALMIKSDGETYTLSLQRGED